MAMKNVVGLFDTRDDAQAALQDLQGAGFTSSDISFVANNAQGDYADTNTSDTDTEAEEGAGIGATSGAVLGGLTGLLVGLGALAIPGIGPVVAAGTLATALGSTALGAGIGAAAGGLVGALVGAGVPEEHANVYAEGVRRGGALITVQANSDDQANRAADIMDRHNVVDVDRRGDEYRASGFDRFDENAEPYSTSDRTRSAGMSDTGYSAGGDADRSIGRDDYDRSSKVGTAGGGLAGAATGAAIGSVGGPVGTVVGGVAGALTGGGIGAAGDAAGAEATDDDANRTSRYDSSATTGGTAYGSATDTGSTRTTDYNTTGTTGYNATGSTANLDQAGEVKIPVTEEELRVGKREVETGGVRVNTRVSETPVNEQVSLHEEHVDVHRTPVDRPVSGADAAAFQEGTFEVRERAEEAVVDKQARVVEEVHVKKTAEDRTETINDTVRRTDVDVQELGGQTRSTNYADTGSRDVTGTTGTSNEGSIERTLGDVNNTVERKTGLDTDRSGDVGDRDTRNNY